MNKENKKMRDEYYINKELFNINKCVDLYQKCIDGKLNTIDDLYEKNKHCLSIDILSNYIETNEMRAISSYDIR